MNSPKAAQDRLEEAIRTLNSAILDQIIEANYFTNDNLIKFINSIIESGSLLSKNPNSKFREKRDGFIIKCKKLIAKIDQSSLSIFERHVATAKLADFCFQEILRSIEDSEINKLTPAEQAWGIINRGLSEYHHLDQKLLSIVKNYDSRKHGIFDPNAVKIEEENIDIDPDQILEGIVGAVGSTLFLLGYKHKWINPTTGLLKLPVKAEPNSEVLFKSGTYTVLAAQWRHTEKAWDRVRFFKSQLTSEDREITDNQGRVRKVKIISGGTPSRIELLDKISINRLQRVFYEHHMGYQSDPAAVLLIGKSEKGIVPLPPMGYVSNAEIVSAGILEDAFCLPISDETQLIEGLPLNVWLRGYAYYGVIAREREDDRMPKCLKFSEEELIQRLRNVGLTSDQAKHFIDLTSFQRLAIDLFDAPLLKSEDGFIYFFPVGHYAAAPSNILLSRIGSLNRRINEDPDTAPIQFNDKGKRFENRTLAILRQNGINAVSFKYKIDGVEYDCDSAFILDGKLFIFECKNYSLPHGRISSLYYFSHDLKSFGKQVKRISLQLHENKQIVRNHLGDDADWEEAVPCVIQALPWSQGRIDGVYYYDQSALSKFLNGTISISAIGNSLHNGRQPIKKIPIRNPDRLTAEDLIKEMKSPIQLKLALKSWEILSTPNPIAKGIFISIPEWHQKNVSMNEQLEILGLDKFQIAKISRELNSSPNPPIKESLVEIIQPKFTKNSKPGRNKECICGSGKKYKKCCGR